ncbi:hypothetical protein JW905_01725 [bacterium]|nr:hypothetical protein [candidate division CSSED10-310 bacterium]
MQHDASYYRLDSPLFQMGNWYIFRKSKALFTFGSTKLAYAFGLLSAYQRIGDGERVGEGLRYWWASGYNSEQYPGMVKLGDPSLRVIEPENRGRSDAPPADSTFTERLVWSSRRSSWISTGRPAPAA